VIAACACSDLQMHVLGRGSVDSATDCVSRVTERCFDLIGTNDAVLVQVGKVNLAVSPFVFFAVTLICLIASIAFWMMQWKLLRSARKLNHSKSAILLALVSLLAIPLAQVVLIFGGTIFLIPLGITIAATGIMGLLMGIDLAAHN
jgi:predicted membrane channel-forming protein YqfA (hemolysin III family)